jgi:hypothetical protein
VHHRVAGVDHLDAAAGECVAQEPLEDADVVAVGAEGPVEGVAEDEDPERSRRPLVRVVPVVEPELVGSVGTVAGVRPDAEADVGIEAVEDRMGRVG